MPMLALSDAEHDVLQRLGGAQLLGSKAPKQIEMESK
jgi:hypothetical protein